MLSSSKGTEERQNLINIRRHLHKHPELAFNCFKTAEFIVQQLRSYGYDAIQEGVATSGVVALLQGKYPGPCIALRSDMDALSMDETGETEYKSVNKGAAHMCGHDAHMACLLTAAKILIKQKDTIHGCVKFIFQPAEEGGGGARVMVKEGVLSNPEVDEIYGLHVWNYMTPGFIGVKSGPVMANSDRFYVTVTGKGGHGGAPETAVDPIVLLLTW